MSAKSGVNQEPGWTRQEWIFEDPGNIPRTSNCSKKKDFSSTLRTEIHRLLGQPGTQDEVGLCVDHRYTKSMGCQENGKMPGDQ